MQNLFIITCSSTLHTVKLHYDYHFEVGRPHEINCTVYTGEVVDSDNVSISWSGHNGTIANESCRITVIPTISDGHIHTSTLQFSYISEEDENTLYNCTASLSGEHGLLFASYYISNLTSKLKMHGNILYMDRKLQNFVVYVLAIK